MGMNSYVVGIKKPDAKWKKMKEVYDTCMEAGTEVPEEVMAFFNDEPPDTGIIVEEDALGEAVENWTREDGNADGFAVDISKLPKGVKKIRFVNSY